MYQQLGNVIIFVQLDDPFAICSQWSKPFNIDICFWVVMEDKELIIQSLAVPTINQFNCILRQLCTNTIINGLRSMLPECQAPCTLPLDTRVGHAHL